MNKFKNYILKSLAAIFAIMIIAVACNEDEDNVYSFDNIPAPSDVSVSFDITQDNTGLVTIAPSATGVTRYSIDFGDGDEAEYALGQVITHTYSEGTFTVGVTAIGINGLSTLKEEQLVVSFIPPSNLVVVTENDLAISKKVNISATADFATVIEFYFGDVDGEQATLAAPGDVVSHQYAEAGTYEIKVVAKNAATQTLTSIFNFVVTEIIGPLDAAPTPVKPASDVISVFSDAYTDITIGNFNPNWGQSTIVTFKEIAGSNVLQYANLNYQGTDFGDGNHIDASGMEFLHVDLWTDDATVVNLSCISPGPLEKPYTFVIVAGQWNSYDIPLSHFADVVDMSDLFQFKFDNGGSGESGTIYLDNIYFYKGGLILTEPASAAPVPTHAAVDVISIFSNAYTDVAGSNFNPNWGQATFYSAVDIAGNNTIKYENLNYQGTEFGTHVDASQMGFLHVDLWTSNATNVVVSIISTGPKEKGYTFTIIAGQWNSYDIPLSYFTEGSEVNLADLFQFKFDNGGSGEAGTIYLDNLYFHK